MNILNEEWRDVVGFEGFYQVSSLGRVRSLDRIIVCGDGRKLPCKGRLLKTHKNKHGYPSASLWLGNKEYKTRVHCLVAYAFLGCRPDGCDVNHIDGNKTNNLPVNLEYCTRSQNNQHAYATGLKISLKGEDTVKCKLTNEQVIEIRVLYAAGGVSHRQLAELYGIAHTNIGCLLRKKTWKHIS